MKLREDAARQALRKAFEKRERAEPLPTPPPTKTGQEVPPLALP